jgi:hypothetical protein
MQQVFQESDSGILIQANKANLFVRILCGLLFLLAVLGICIIPLLLFTNDFGIYIDLAIGAVAILRGFTARYF